MQQWLQILISNEKALSCCHRFEETIPSFLLGENLILPFFIFLYRALVVHFLFLLCIKHYTHSLDFGQFWLDNRENNVSLVFLSEMWFDLMICLLQKKMRTYSFLLGYWWNRFLWESFRKWLNLLANFPMSYGFYNLLLYNISG